LTYNSDAHANSCINIFHFGFFCNNGAQWPRVYLPWQNRSANLQSLDFALLLTAFFPVPFFQTISRLFRFEVGSYLNIQSESVDHPLVDVKHLGQQQSSPANIKCEI